MDRGTLKNLGIIIGLIIVLISASCKQTEQIDAVSPANTIEAAATPIPLVIPNEYENVTEIDIDKNTIEQILGLTDGVLSVCDITEEFCFTNTNGVYRAMLHGIADTYYIKINTNGIDTIEKLMYPQMEIEIISQNEGWKLSNPSSADIEMNIYNKYLADDEHRTTPIPIGEDDIYILYLDDVRRETIIPIGENLQSEVIDGINNPTQTIILDDYENTDQYYFATDIRLVVPNDNEDPIEYELLINRYSDMVLHHRWDYKAIVNDELAELIVSFMHNTSWYYISLEQIKDISLAQMWYKGEKIAEIYDYETMKELEEMLYNARCIGYTPKTMMYGPYIEIGTPNGQFQINIDLYDDIMKLGSSFHYDYGPGVAGTEPKDNYPKMLALFGLEEMIIDDYAD